MFINIEKVANDLYPFPISLNAKAILMFTSKTVLPGDIFTLLAGGDEKYLSVQLQDWQRKDRERGKIHASLQSHFQKLSGCCMRDTYQLVARSSAKRMNAGACKIHHCFPVLFYVFDSTQVFVSCCIQLVLLAEQHFDLTQAWYTGCHKKLFSLLVLYF